jgi:hypothetical protein
MVVPHGQGYESHTQRGLSHAESDHTRGVGERGGAWQQRDGSGMLPHNPAGKCVQHSHGCPPMGTPVPMEVKANQCGTRGCGVVHGSASGQ